MYFISLFFSHKSQRKFQQKYLDNFYDLKQEI